MFNVQIPEFFIGESDSVRSYFNKLILKYGRAINLHVNPGDLWNSDEHGRNWKNVTEHCLIEAARVEELTELLGFDPELQDKLIEAAVVHDFYKKREIELTRIGIEKGDSGREGVLKNEDEAVDVLLGAGFSQKQIAWTQSVSGDPQNVHRMKKIIDAGSFDLDKIADLILHYVDNYTRGSSWVAPAELQGTKIINDIDRRNLMNAENPDYRKMNEEGRELNSGHPFFDGMTRFESAAAVNHEIEKVFFKIITNRGFTLRFPQEIPEFIDTRIRKRIG